MRLAAIILLLALAPAASAGAATRLNSTRAIRAAKQTKPTLFALFPERVGTTACRIPLHGTQRAIAGRCATRVAVGPGFSGRITVFFTESWSRGSTRLKHTWRVIESPVGRPLTVQSVGSPPPQLAR
jgi:hypothetical protein